MKDVWSQQPPSEKPNRNTFDLSFRNNLSMKIGKIYPVMCKEVIPGDTFHIDAQFGLSFMPMYFPIQTPLRAHLSFYYVRNRNLWKNWKKFLRNKGQINPATDFPYISGSADHLKELFKIGGLADYLGCPTNVASVFEDSYIQNLMVSLSSGSSLTAPLSPLNVSSYIINAPNTIAKQPTLSIYMNHFTNFSNDMFVMSSWQRIENQNLVLTNNTIPILSYRGDTTPTDTSVTYYPILLSTQGPNSVGVGNDDVYIDGQLVQVPKNFGKLRIVALSSVGCTFTYDSSRKVYKYDANNTHKFYNLPMYYKDSVITTELQDVWKENNDGNLIFALVGQMPDGTNIKDDGFMQISSIGFDYIGTNVYSQDTNAYTSGHLKISALPFRAYESVYNALIRSTQNDPFMINGVEEYDKFITNDNDGADATDYHIFDAYWENDHLTESFQSPQQGDAPLLGLSGTTTPPTSLSTSYLLRYTTEDGSQNNIRVRKNNNKLEFDTTNQNNLSKELQGDLAALNNAAQFGISINDLRNVNSLQRWLENAIMNGYRYKDIIRGHFGIDISLKELEMPEFLGGKSEFVNVSPVQQQTEGSLPLGWKAGQASLFSGMQNGIDKYCDEHGFIIATLTVIPVPVYQQLLPKFFTKFGVLDYYSPEFKNIGMQPQKYREVCPLETLNAGESLEGVFSYQRPWYDYLGSVDEAHGQFRDTLSGYLMTRIFHGKPVLGADFLKINHETTDNVFVVTAGEDDKIFGQVQFSIKAERPIPLFNRPRLE